MDEDECGSSEVWNIHSDTSLDDVVLSVYNWGYLQAGLCNWVKCCSTGMYWSLDQIDNLLSSSRPSQMVLQRFWISMASIHVELDAMDQE